MPKWLNDAVFYEIYPSSFCDSNGDGIGDINGIRSKLDYIAELGFNALWLNPCFESPFLDGGYDVSNYCKVAPRYGTNEDLALLFGEAHERGIKVLLDLVPGHTSDRHPWFIESQRDGRNEFTDYYHWTNHVFDAPSGLRMVSGMAERNGNYLINFFSSQPALNYGWTKRDYDWQQSPEDPGPTSVRNELKRIMRFWMDLGADGFRVDMAASLVKNDEPYGYPGTKRIWQDIRAMMDRDYPECALISEWSDAVNSIEAGFHMDFYIQFGCKGWRALFQNVSGDNPKEKSAPFFHPDGIGDITAFTDEYVPWLNQTKGKGYICMVTGNHDTIRYSYGRDEQQMKLVAAFLFTMPGVPFLYYGDEIGMRYNNKLVSKEGGYHRTGSRTPMQWSRGKNLGFTDSDATYLPVDTAKDAPTVEEKRKDKKSLYHTVKQAVALRHAHPGLQADGDFAVVYAEKNKYPFVYRRGNLLIAVNPHRKEQQCPLTLSPRQELFAVGKSAKCKKGTLVCPGESLTVFSL